MYTNNNENLRRFEPKLLVEDSNVIISGDVLEINEALPDLDQVIGLKKKKNAPTKEQIEKER